MIYTSSSYIYLYNLWKHELKKFHQWLRHKASSVLEDFGAAYSKMKHSHRYGDHSEINVTDQICLKLSLNVLYQALFRKKN